MGGHDTESHAVVASSELMDRLCDNVLRLLSAAPFPARGLRLRVGDVAVELELGTDAEVVTTDRPEPAEADASADEGDRILARTVGVFYQAPEPGADPFVREGDVVTEGQQVGIIEAMKLMIPVEADRAGRITAVLKSDGEPVEYGEPLFTLAAS